MFGKDSLHMYVKNQETGIWETIFLKLNISNKKWVIGFAYRIEKSSNKTLFFVKQRKLSIH